MPNLHRIVWSTLALSLATAHAARADEPSPLYAYFGAGLGYVHLADNLTYTDDGDLVSRRGGDPRIDVNARCFGRCLEVE